MLRRDDMGSASYARGLHVALDEGFQRADFEVSVDSPVAYIGCASVKPEMQFGCFIVEGLGVVGEAVSVAVDAIEVVGPDMPEPRRWCAVAGP